MASVPKIVPSVVIKPFAKTASSANVTGGRLATGARNVASVSGPAVEEISPEGGISRDESNILFQDYARPVERENKDPTRHSPATQDVGFVVAAAFQVQELGGMVQFGASAPGSGVAPDRFARAVESYRLVQDAADEPESPVGGSLSLKL